MDYHDEEGEMGNGVDTDNEICRTLLKVAAAHGVKEVVCSPGSRNAPLLIAAHFCRQMRKRVVVDERTAAFIALGLSTVSREPTMLICTSGTALLNYAPAVAEAYHSGVPLIVVSADRPLRWIDQDDSQTIMQFEALRNFVKGSFDIPSSSSGPGEGEKWYANRIVNEAMLKAMKGKPGPVHINVRIETPLGNLRHYDGKELPRIVTEEVQDTLFRPEHRRGLAERGAGKRIMIVAGFLPPDHEMNRVLMSISTLPNVCIMAETLSNLHAGKDSHIIDPVLSIMTPQEKEKLRPDIVISMGGPLVSRMIKDYLRNYPPAEHWSLNRSDRLADCFECLTRIIPLNPASFLKLLYSGLKKKGRTFRPNTDVPSTNENATPADDYASGWREMRSRAQRYLSDYVKNIPWCDMKAFRIISGMVPREYNLFLSNGTAVRYDQLFATNCHATYCNRGVSGIDGCTSTAIGGAIAYRGNKTKDNNNPRPTLLITGDTSFGYDAGALACEMIPEGMKIILIRNGGGGIFRFIGATSSLPEEILGKYFCAPMELPVGSLCKAYGLVYIKITNEKELVRNLKEFLGNPTPGIMEILTDGKTSAEVLHGYFKNPDFQVSERLKI